MSGRPWRFRPLNADQLDEIEAVLAEGRAAIGRLGIDQWQDGYPERERLERDVAEGIAYGVLDEEGKLLGYAAVDFSGEPTYDVIDGTWLTASSSQDPRYGVIHRIAVADGARRQGVARYLLEAAASLGRKRGAESLRIDTHPGNGPMQRLIAASDFTYCGIILIDLARETTKERLAYERLLA